MSGGLLIWQAFHVQKSLEVISIDMLLTWPGIECYGLDNSGFNSLQVQQLVVFSKMSQWTQRPTQPPVQCIPRFFPWGLIGEGVKLTTHFQLVLRLRMPGAISLLPVCTLTAWPGPTLPLPFTYSLTRSSCLCSDVCLTILIYIYSSHFNAHLPRPLCPVCFEIWSKTRQFISHFTTGLWEKFILSEIYIFIFGTRTIRKQ